MWNKASLSHSPSPIQSFLPLTAACSPFGLITATWNRVNENTVLSTRFVSSSQPYWIRHLQNKVASLFCAVWKAIKKNEIIFVRFFGLR